MTDTPRPLPDVDVPRRSAYIARPPETTNLADLLERVLDKGVVIAGDIRINLLDIELLTVKLRLLVASVDRARELGIAWWEEDDSLSIGGRERERRALEQRIRRLESAAGLDEAASGEREHERDGDAGGG